MKKKEFEILLNSVVSANDTHSCNCIGPQDGDPVCPCQMSYHLQRQAERAAWEREQIAIRKAIEGQASND